MANRKLGLTTYSSSHIRDKIVIIRDRQVLLDTDLAEFYGVETKRLNEQVKRNIGRFPPNFMFQLTKKEFNLIQNNLLGSSSLRSQNATLKGNQGKNRKYLPYVFTEQGVAMLSGVLKSDTAIKTSILIIETFVAMRKYLVNNAQLFQKLETVELKQLKYQIETDQKFEQVFNALQENSIEPKHGIFFNGQVFDAYKFVTNLIRKANSDIILIDNYIDETVLEMFTKKKKDVSIKVFTKRITKTMQLDVEKFNEQYPVLEVREFKESHDRFLIVDNKIIYHIGASLKDLGKKWFAFSKIDIPIETILNKLS